MAKAGAARWSQRFRGGTEWNRCVGAGVNALPTVGRFVRAQSKERERLIEAVPCRTGGRAVRWSRSASRRAVACAVLLLITRFLYARESAQIVRDHALARAVARRDSAAVDYLLAKGADANAAVQSSRSEPFQEIGILVTRGWSGLQRSGLIQYALASNPSSDGQSSSFRILRSLSRAGARRPEPRPSTLRRLADCDSLLALLMADPTPDLMVCHNLVSDYEQLQFAFGPNPRVCRGLALALELIHHDREALAALDAVEAIGASDAATAVARADAQVRVNARNGIEALVSASSGRRSIGVVGLLSLHSPAGERRWAALMRSRGIPGNAALGAFSETAGVISQIGSLAIINIPSWKTGDRGWMDICNVPVQYSLEPQIMVRMGGRLGVSPFAGEVFQWSGSQWRVTQRIDAATYIGAIDAGHRGDCEIEVREYVKLHQNRRSINWSTLLTWRGGRWQRVVDEYPEFAATPRITAAQSLSTMPGNPYALACLAEAELESRQPVEARTACEMADKAIAGAARAGPEPGRDADLAATRERVSWVRAHLAVAARDR